MTGAQVPAVLPSQAWQTPVQSESQQTPSARWLLTHCEAAVALVPLGNWATQVLVGSQ